MRRGLADALDMLTVCVEAGQGFDAAILQVARTVTGPIGGEFARVLSEIQIGKRRADAFASLGERTTAPEVKTFVSALVQADRHGSARSPRCCGSRPRRCVSPVVSGRRSRRRRSP